MKEQKHLGLQADASLINKFSYASKYYGRTKSGQIVYLIRKFVEEFEKKNGVISDEDLKNTGIK